ncbi:MAG: purine-binding chemotaxis protein CheW [Anaerolineae bacterium]|nr:purine-binding chemotaxis protein CheW [Anaerolineae bacterium]
MLRYIVSDWRPRDPTEEETQEILYKRARTLARPAEGSDALNNTQRVLVFTLGTERYAVPVVYVQRIKPFDQMTPIPCTPSFYLGAANVRGKILSVLELRYLFDIPIEDESALTLKHLVVISAAGLEVSLLVHDIAGVTDLMLSDLKTPSEALVGISPDYIAGTTAEGIILLDVEILLSDSRLIVDEEVI